MELFHFELWFEFIGLEEDCDWEIWDMKSCVLPWKWSAPGEARMLFARSQKGRRRETSWKLSWASRRSRGFCGPRSSSRALANVQLRGEIRRMQIGRRTLQAHLSSAAFISCTSLCARGRTPNCKLPQSLVWEKSIRLRCPASFPVLQQFYNCSRRVSIR